VSEQPQSLEDIYIQLQTPTLWRFQSKSPSLCTVLLYWLEVNVLIQEVWFVDKPLLIGKATTVQSELQISSRYRQALVFSIIVVTDVVSSLLSCG
jgi:hypothetical protein